MRDELTKIDIQKMKEEIEYRKGVLAPKLRSAVKSARELGDLSENDEYRSAKRELNRNNSRIHYLQTMIDTAVVISTDSKQDEVGLFDEVEIYYEDDDESRTIRIVTTLRNNVFKDCISKESPLGSALLGKKVGERVIVKVNEKVKYPVVIKAITKGEDDDSLSISQF
ncbi:MAG: transcription elongation factor GreA [Clostridiales bacterium]|nr:transcription elongation factor GreA [Clostridiales bacterium]